MVSNFIKACGRLTLLLFAWILFGFLTAAQICVSFRINRDNDKSSAAANTKQSQVTRSGKLHVAAHIVGLLILFGGGAAVTGGTGGYVPCPNNITMDRHCMYTQPAGYMFPYILHYVGGSYSCVASWFLDLCHLVPWSVQGYPLTIFCTPQKNVRSVPFESKWHLIAKGFVTVVVILTWMLLVDWSTDPELSRLVHPETSFVGLGSLLGIFLIEAIVIFVVVSCSLSFYGRSNRGDEHGVGALPRMSN
jgi:hypothetical protein